MGKGTNGLDKGSRHPPPTHTLVILHLCLYHNGSIICRKDELEPDKQYIDLLLLRDESFWC